MRNTDIYKNKSIELLKEYNLLEIPIDIDKLAQKLDIKVKYEKIESKVSGKIEYSNSINEVVITINMDEHNLRQRFALAHEIGHYIYDIDFTKDAIITDFLGYERSGSQTIVEERADNYAEQLLLPYDLLLKEIRLAKQSIADYKIGDIKSIYILIVRIARKFNVSKPTVIIRTSNLNFITKEQRIKLLDYHCL
jgi:Zn-dependent peptidase ImmA (M78 family)